MIADQNFYGICFMLFYATASATVYGRRPKFVMAEHSATAEGENCAYGPTLLGYPKIFWPCLFWSGFSSKFLESSSFELQKCNLDQNLQNSIHHSIFLTSVRLASSKYIEMGIISFPSSQFFTMATYNKSNRRKISIFHLRALCIGLKKWYITQSYTYQVL